MRNFWRFLLRRSLPADSLKHTRVAVFGLGDSSYPKFNLVAKQLARRLLELGATELIPRGLGDEQHPTGIDAELSPWVKSCWAALRELFPLPPSLEDPAEDAVLPLGEAKLQVRYTKEGEPAMQTAASAYHVSIQAAALARSILDTLSSLALLNKQASSNEDGIVNSSNRHRPCVATVKEAKSLTTVDSPVEVRHLSLALEQPERNSTAARAYHQPGDVVGVVPPPESSSLSEFLELCGLAPDAVVQLRRSSALAVTDNDGDDGAWSSHIRVAALVGGGLDFASASPRRYFFEVLSHFATAEHEKERLEYLGSSDGAADMWRYNTQERRNVIEILKDFPSARLPLPWLLQVVPRLEPRFFSVSNAWKKYPNEAHMCIGTVEWQTPYKRTIKGLCSNWLRTLKIGDCLGVWLEQATLKLPPTLATPDIRIGQGTGGAPFRAFLQHRQQQRARMSNANAAIGECFFFFGCRYQSRDFLYNEDWQDMANDGTKQ